MRLAEYLPDLWDPCAEVIALQNALEPEVITLWAAKDGLLEQLHVATATWGLEAWERALGIEVDVSRPTAFRRTRVLSKLRGQGTTTVVMIQNVAESFSNGAVDVIEHAEEYRFEIKFTGTVGIPPNMEDLSAAIEEIKPAHMAYSYIILFRTHQMLGRYTHGQLAGYTHEQLRSGKVVE